MTTVKQVAARAGVSASTVSNVFIGRVPVREMTKRRVLRAAEQLGYQPDGLAQALRTGRTRTLGLLVPHITNPTIAAFVHGAARAAQEGGYAASVCAIENDPALQRTYLDLLRRERVAAVIAQPAGPEPEPYEALARAGAALVFVDRKPARLKADSVTPDYRAAVREAVLHLFEQGRRRVALVTGARWIDSTRRRLAGYAAAHRDAGVPVDERLIVTAERRAGTAREAVAALLARAPGEARPDAIVAGSADVTLAVLAALREHGVSIPGEVAMVGTGDVAWAPLADPPLTMIEIDGRELGRRAVEMALERIATRSSRGSGSEIVLPARLVVRASSSG
jgi:LacI family transcriptional regulator